MERGPADAIDAQPWGVAAVARRIRILAVDDDPEIVSILRRGLTHEGYIVDTAGDGPEALAKARDGEPDLVLLDAMVRGVDGGEVSKRLRQVGDVSILMPSPEEVPEMGMIKVSNMLAGLVDTSRFLVREATFDPEEAVTLLTQWENDHIRHIVGPPFLVHRLAQHLKKCDIHLELDKETRIINLGGWKRFTGEHIPREEYSRECAEYLGVQPSQIRDMYGLIEGNMVAIECSHHRKHVPPWVHFSARELHDPREEIHDGRRGVLGIIDPTCLAYPAYILTEDMVHLDETSSCPCGRNGQKVDFVARVEGSELGCCAVNLEKAMYAGAREVLV